MVSSISDRTPAENLSALAKAKGVDVKDITACILDRPRHASLIEAVRDVGSAIQLIGDGDIAGVISTTDPDDTGIDIYMGIGGAPEGVLAAAALRCIGGQMQGRLVTSSDDQKARARKMGIEDFDRKYTMQEMASGDVIFAAAGVTDGSMLSGVKMCGDAIYTETVVMRSSTGTTRWIKAKAQAPVQIRVTGPVAGLSDWPPCLSTITSKQPPCPGHRARTQGHTGRRVPFSLGPGSSPGHDFFGCVQAVDRLNVLVGRRGRE